MGSLATVGFLCAMTIGADPIPDTTGFLYQPAFCLDKQLRGPARPYIPQPGDLIFESDDRKTWAFGHNLAKTGHPHHSLTVFRKPDGGLAVLEAGGSEETPSRVATSDLYPHLLGEEAKTGRKERRIWVRQRKVPLTPEQSEALTNFALQAEGKRFARFKLFVLMTPIRAKGPIRTAWLGKPDFDKNSYFCSEMVITTLAAVGLIDADLARPGATFPHDLFMGESRNYWVNRSVQQINCDWEPPARWTNCPTDVVDASPKP